MILVLSTPGWLLLPEVGYRIQVKPGDVVALQASQQLHKLELDSANPNATQLVFTLWTDHLSNKDANPNGSSSEDFYVVNPGEGDELDGEESGGEWACIQATSPLPSRYLPATYFAACDRKSPQHERRFRSREAEELRTNVKDTWLNEAAIVVVCPGAFEFTSSTSPNSAAASHNNVGATIPPPACIR
jgi:hypothetical protein